MLGQTTLTTILFAVADSAGISGQTMIQGLSLIAIVVVGIVGRNAEKRELQNSLRNALDSLCQDIVSQRLHEHRLIYRLGRAARAHSARRKRK